LSDDSDGAGGAIRRARRLSSDAVQQTQLAAAQIRLLVKRGEFGRARSVADSLLLTWSSRDAPPKVAEALSGISALTGRIERTSRFAAIAPTSGFALMGVAPALAIASTRFAARAAPGVCDDSVRTLRLDFERVLDSYSTPSRRDQLRQAMIWQGAALAFPCLRGDAIRGLAANSPLDRAQRAFATGDFTRTRVLLDSLDDLRVGYRPGDISLDHTVQEAWLRASVGDTAAAERRLDLVLEALPTLGVQAVLEPAQSAALGRAMALRADLAFARNNRSVSRRWATAVIDLWTNADQALAPTVARMQGMAGR
jgi:hypothetical protein